MGFLGRLFGRSSSTSSDASSRCNECGMTGGRHTDWCPLATEPERPTSGAGAGGGGVGKGEGAGGDAGRTPPAGPS